MKVAYFSNHFTQANGHGIARYVQRLYASLHDLKKDIHLVPVTSLGEREIHNIDQLKLESNLKLLPWGRYATAISWGFLKRPYLERWIGKDYDLVHAPNLGYPVPTKKPYVVTVHDIGPITRPEFFSKRAIRWMKLGFPHMVKKAAAIICVSKTTADEVMLKAGRHLHKKIFVTHEGVEEQFFQKPKMRSLEQLRGLPPQGTPFCLAAGAISPRKNVITIIKAIEMLKDVLPHHLCLVGGSGWDAKLVFDMFENSSVSERIHHLGYVSDEQLHALYNTASVFIYPSLFEGFGLPIIEAMASGCPVVTSNISSMPEIAGDSANLADPHDLTSIRDAIYRVCSNLDYARQLSERGKKRARSFTWRECARKTSDVYHAVI